VTLGNILTWFAVGATAILLPLSFVVPRLLTAQNRRRIAAGTELRAGGAAAHAKRRVREASQSRTGELASVYLTQLIVGEALVEAPALMAAIFHIIEKNAILLGLGLLLLGALVVRFPTRSRVERWIDRQQELLIGEGTGAPLNG
jgi:hypothetical protein